jgi:hypothetical protein
MQHALSALRPDVRQYLLITGNYWPAFYRWRAAHAGGAAFIVRLFTVGDRRAVSFYEIFAVTNPSWSSGARGWGRIATALSSVWSAGGGLADA